MIIDALVIVALFFGLLGGWLRGMLYQLGQLAVLAAAFLLARGLSAPFESALVDTGLDRSLASLVGFATVFLVVTIVGSWILWRFTKMMRQSSEALGRADRVLGLVTGGAKMALVCYVVVLTLVMLERHGTSLPIAASDSSSGRWVAENNVLRSGHLPEASALLKLAVVVGHHDLLSLATDPDAQAILMHPKAAVLREPAVLAALANKDFVYLMDHDGLWELLSDHDVQRHIDALEQKTAAGRS